METSKQMTEAMQEIASTLQRVVRMLEGQSQRIEEIQLDIARLKESQNDILAGLALYERARRLKESLGMEESAPGPQPGPWESIDAYCRNCTRMVPIVQATATFHDERTVVEAKCRNCGTKVVRTLL